MSYLCSKGHVSDDPDFCSECGLRIEPEGAAAPAAAAALESCPVCSAAREPGAIFCEVCRYNFATQQSDLSIPASSPVSRQEPEAAPVASSSTSAAPAAASPGKSTASADPALSPFYGYRPWVRVVADRSLASPEDAAIFPSDEPETTFPLDTPESLVGRRSNKPGLHPEVPVNDRAVSSRHLKLCVRPVGVVLVDLGSTNGTLVNGVAVAPGVETVVGPSDKIVIGAWTRLILEAK